MSLVKRAVIIHQLLQLLPKVLACEIVSYFVECVPRVLRRVLSSEDGYRLWIAHKQRWFGPQIHRTRRAAEIKPRPRKQPKQPKQLKHPKYTKHNRRVQRNGRLHQPRK